MDKEIDIKFQKGCIEVLVYPLSQKQLKTADMSSLASPRIGRSHGMVNDVAGNEEDLLFEVLDTRAMVARGQMPWEYLDKYYPEDWGDLSREIPHALAAKNLSYDRPSGLAHIVHMDSPSDMPVAVLNWVIDAGYMLKKDTVGIPFISLVPEMEYKIARRVKKNLDKAFDVKWYYGQARPEELMGFNCTHYEKGCPTHPSWPAGHGAAAAAVAEIIEAFDLDDYGLKQVRTSAFIWSHARTLAGVHYYPDNHAGMVVGGLI